MATKNKNIKTHDLDSVFSEYSKAISLELEEKRIQLENEINTLKDEIQNEVKTLSEAEINSISVLSAEEKADAEKKLAIANKYLTANTLTFNKISKEDISSLSQEEQDLHIKKVEKAESLLKKSQEQYDLYKAIVDENNSKLEKIEALTNKPEESINSEQLKEKEQKLNDLQAELKILPKKPIDNLESFIAFLEANGFSSSHADDLYNHHNNPNDKYLVNSDDFKMRKEHRKRDFFIKKILIPSTLTGGAIGALISFIAKSGAISGSNVAHLFPVFSELIMTGIASGTIGALIGAATSVIVFKAKEFLTKAHYSFWYKNASKNLEELNNTDINNLPIAKLMQKVENTSNKVLKFKGLKKHIYNAVNRNRIHHIEKYVKQLQKQYKAIDQDVKLTPKVKAQKLLPIYQLLKQVDTFIKNDVEKSITHAYLTCKESKKHTHPNMLENIDIYANLKIANDAETNKRAKTTFKNLSEKKRIATEIANGASAIPCISDYEKKYAKFSKFNSKTLTVTERKLDKNNNVIITLENGEVKTLPIDKAGINPIIGVQSSKKKETIFYEDGSKKVITKNESPDNKEFIANDEALKSLNENEQVKETLTEQFGKKTIKNLIAKISESIASGEKIVTRGKTKQAYDALIELETENRKALKEDNIYVNINDLVPNNEENNIVETQDFGDDEIFSL